MTEPLLRPADPGDEPRLRAVAEASKAHWGYDAERVGNWAETLDLSREIWIAEVAGEIVAWSALLPPSEGICELDDLWVEPRAIGTGIGTVLFRQAEAHARHLGARALRWEADPNAVGFYERMGAAVVGTATSSWSRSLPVMQVEL
ncbi:MAG TPA: GNAT family N-acetyltransferase [Gaiellaceae bacterium]